MAQKEASELSKSRLTLRYKKVAASSERTFETSSRASVVAT